MIIQAPNAPESDTPIRLPKPITLKKKLLFSGVVVLTIYLTTELIALAVLCWQHRTWSSVHTERQRIAARDPFLAPHGLSQEVMIHPFVGYVLQPKIEPNRTDRLAEAQKKFEITEFGFHDNQPPIHKRSEDRTIVGILGGSVAMQLAVNATVVFEQELASLHGLQGKRFEFVRLGVSGFKQPQQLMTLNYLMSLGAEFDIVINLDGANEAALPLHDNVRYGVNAAFPRQWSSLLAVRGNAEAARRVGYVSYLRQVQRERATQFGNAWLGHSPLATLIWKVLYNRSAAQIRDQTTRIAEQSTQELSFAASGPKEVFESDERTFEHCVELWTHSSILLARLCASHGIRYFHFLQPNQYLSGSKPMGEAETQFATNNVSIFHVPIERCYPKMRANADRLRRAGVSFGDLTQVFADSPEPLYIDDCCHVNDAGDRIIANAIARHIRAAWNQSTDIPNVRSPIEVNR